MQKSTKRKRAPGPPFSLALLKRFQRNILETLEEITTHGPITRVRLGPFLIHLVRDPDAIQRVLQGNHTNYRKSKFYAELRPILGQGLVTSDGEQWLQQRRLIQPAFQRNRVEGFVSIFQEETENTARTWTAASREDPLIDVAAGMMALTFRIVSRALFTGSAEDKSQEIAGAVDHAAECAVRRASNPFHPPLWFPTALNRRYRRAVATMDTIVFQMIAQRRQEISAGQAPDDLLTRLLEARDDETHKSMDDRQLRDEVLTLLLAGHETTSNALTWTLYLLCQSPEVMRRLREESMQVLGGRTPDLNDLPRLDYARMVLEESMRLLPPVWMIERDALADDELGGYHIPAGSTVSMSQWVVHRHADLWPDPLRFDPERFAEGNARHKFSYFPFGAGPRLCIGRTFALLEAQIILCGLVQRFDFALPPGAAVAMEAHVTLRPRGGLPMIVKPIGKAPA